MTQRRLDPEQPPDEAAPDDAAIDDASTPSLSPVPQPEPERAAPPEPIVLSGPSDTELRKRQEAWFAERARREAARRSSASADGAP
jgi:hypothetical protein